MPLGVRRALAQILGGRCGLFGLQYDDLGKLLVHQRRAAHVFGAAHRGIRDAPFWRETEA